MKSYDSSLPSDSRTLLQTAKKIDTVMCGDGSFVYFGLENNIVKRVKSGLVSSNYPLLKSRFRNRKFLSVTLNTDGLPVHSSTTNSFWPILGIVDQAINKTPFVIALYYGEGKPNDSNLFFNVLWMNV